ncbi:MAG: tetratricopeptide repeat protein [Deltaproteobacteria bacterium]|nr:tetratricopeptide repeat protein [Deltaproteobacteria bacterium]
MRRRSILSVILGVWLPCAPGFAAIGDDRTTLQAIGALDRGRDPEALATAAAILGREPADGTLATARFTAARAALNLGDPEAARTYLNGLEAFLPEVADVVVALRARAVRQAGDWGGAVQVWEHLLRQFPASPYVTEAWLGLADAAFAANDLARAQSGYRTALRRGSTTPSAAIARYNLARIDEVSGQTVSAVATYVALAFSRPTTMISEAALARLAVLKAQGLVPPAPHKVLLQRAERLLQARQLTAARVALAEARAAVASALQGEATTFREAQLAYYERDFATAIPVLEALARAPLGPKQLTYQSWLARAQSASGDIEHAIATYRDLAARHPARREAREALFKAAWLLFNSRRYDQSVALFGEFLSRYSRDRRADEALWYVAWNTYRMGDLPTLLALFARLRREYAGSELVQRTHYWEGRVLVTLAREADAVAAFSEAARLEPLSYYGVLSRQRLQELGAGETLALSTPPLLAALQAAPAIEGEISDVPAAAAGPEMDELPADGSYTAPEPAEVPWGAGVVDWSSATGQRALTLVRLGLRREAVDLVAALPDLPVAEGSSAILGRARLYHALGAYDRASRLASAAFAGKLRGEPRAGGRPFFHLAYPAAHADLVEAAATEFGTSPWLILAVMRQESAFRPEVRSPMNARGLMQILPTTAERIADALEVQPFASEMLNSPGVNVRFGAWYLAQLMAKFEGNPVLTVSAYNAGPRAVTEWVKTGGGVLTDEFVEEIPFKETRGYVRHVIGNLAVYSALYGDKTLQLPPRLPTATLDEPSF